MRPYVRVTGNIINASVDISSKATFLGSADGTSKLTGVLQGPVGFDILNLVNGSVVEIYDLTLADSPQAAIAVSATSRLRMVRSKIINSSRDGVFAQGKAEILQSEITRGNYAFRSGIDVRAGGELVMDRSQVSFNLGGGVEVGTGGKFSITNSFIVGNQRTGGIYAPNPVVGSKLEYSTIVDNRESDVDIEAGGVTCDVAGIVFSNNIIFRNIGGPAGTTQTFGACTYGTSYVAAGTGPGDTTLGFKVDTATEHDYHLTAGSPPIVKDVEIAACTEQMDYDAEARPQGGACELGADEVQ